jgi:hypothetical protein
MQQRATQQQEQLERGIDTLTTGGFRMFEFATKLHAESLRFVGQRMNDYVKASEELRQCRSPADVLSVHANLVLQALSDYHAEADKIIKGFMNLQKPVQHAIESALENYEDSILESQDEQNGERSGRRRKSV